MEQKSTLHIVDRVSRTVVVTCGSFLAAVTASGLAYLWFGV